VIETILVGSEDEIMRLSAADWKLALADAPEHISHRLDFMSDDHHRVRNFVVREMPRIGRPIDPHLVSDALHLSPGLTEKILDELEKGLFFLVRDEHGAVTWAFPVTVEETPHRLVFDTGERLNAA
jgi:hypothetical protein